MGKVTTHYPAFKSHGQADRSGHHSPGDLPRDGAPKHVTKIVPHPGMTKRVGGTTINAGGDQASAIDALTGQSVVPGHVTSTPGFGNAGAQSGSPLAKAPGGKVMKPVAASFGQRSRTSPHSAELGAAILRAALKN